MRFDMKSFLEGSSLPYSNTVDEDMSQADFTGFTVPERVTGKFTAELVLEGIQMELALTATVMAECARCLAPVTEAYHFTRTYLVRPSELSDPDFELPVDDAGCLDVSELVYQELLFEIPSVILCDPNCLGLCPVCGKRKAAGCSCQQADNAAPADARLSILKQLLS